MISTDTETDDDEDEYEEERQAALVEGLQRIADSIKAPTVTVPVTVQPAPRPKQMHVRGLYDGRTVDLTITLK
jgi:hypothetical protein